MEKLTFDEMFSVLGIETPSDETLLEIGKDQVIAFIKLETIARYLNEMSLIEDNGENYYPMFKWTDDHSDIVFDEVAYNPDKSYASIWSRFYTKSEELAEYLGKNYLDLWKILIQDKIFTW